MSLWLKLVLIGAAGLLLPFIGFQFARLTFFGGMAPFVCLALLLAGAALGLRDWLAGDADPEEVERDLEASRSIREIGDRRFK